jgi:hypothetical protein
MGWLSRIAGFTERLRLDVLMRFDIRSGHGCAGVRWTILEELEPRLLAPHQSALVALLYARTLVNHSETRTELFDRMTRLTRWAATSAQSQPRCELFGMRSGAFALGVDRGQGGVHELVRRNRQGGRRD